VVEEELKNDGRAKKIKNLTCQLKPPKEETKPAPKTCTSTPI
jgi:hypothetical protein